MLLLGELRSIAPKTCRFIEAPHQDWDLPVVRNLGAAPEVVSSEEFELSSMLQDVDLKILSI